VNDVNQYYPTVVRESLAAGHYSERLTVKQHFLEGTLQNDMYDFSVFILLKKKGSLPLVSTVEL
jgi:hypothetical protein